MAFTPLQKMTIKRAVELAGGVKQTTYSMANKHEFAGPLCERNSPESDWLCQMSELEDLLAALSAES